MPEELIAPEQHRQTAEGAREKAEDGRQSAEEDRRLTEEHRNSAESLRSAAEQFRRLAEEARSASEDARNAAESARHEAEAARDATINAVRATADTLEAAAAHMKVVEEMRRTLRAVRGANKPGLSARYAPISPPPQVARRCARPERPRRPHCRVLPLRAPSPRRRLRRLAYSHPGSSSQPRRSGLRRPL